MWFELFEELPFYKIKHKHIVFVIIIVYLRVNNNY